jgi:hypothetical protein
MPRLTNAQAAANARKPYADHIRKLENEIRLLRALAKTLGATDAALNETRYTPEPQPYHCQLCGQHITDGKPCGCGARYVGRSQQL